MSTKEKNKKILSVSNLLTLALLVFTAAMFIFPEFKATVLQGLMKIGLFQPGVSDKNVPSTPEKNWNVSFTNSKGEIVDGNSLKDKVVFINYWATWCPPCIAEMPSINELYNEYKNNPDIVFLLVDADNDFTKSESFMKKKSFNLPIYTSQTQAPPEWYEGSLPTTVVLDKKGGVAFKHTGVANYESKKFRDFLQKLSDE